MRKEIIYLILHIFLWVGCINTQKKDQNLKIDVIKLLDSAFKKNNPVDGSIKLDLSKEIHGDFKEHFNENYTFYLKSNLVVDYLYEFKPSIKYENLYIFKYDKYIFLVYDDNTKSAFAFVFGHHQSVRKEINTENLFSCHYLDKNLNTISSFITIEAKFVIQRYHCDSKYFILEQCKLVNDSIGFDLFSDYNKMYKTFSSDFNKECVVYKTWYLKKWYCNTPTFCIETFDFPYEDPFE
jgi:hypothetical protein